MRRVEDEKAKAHKILADNNRQMSGFGFQVSAQPPAKETAGLIEKETPTRQMPNVD
jgi:hypothetical protein